MHAARREHADEDAPAQARPSAPRTTPPLPVHPHVNELAVAAANGQVAALQRMLRRPDAARYINEISSYGWTPLSVAVSKQQPAAACALLDAGASPGAPAPGVTSPLHMAAALGAVDTTELLLHRGADPNATQEHGFTPLMHAARGPELFAAAGGDHLQCLKLLVAAGANVPYARPSDGRTALFMACCTGKAEPIDLLLAHGASATARCRDKGFSCTPLIAAAARACPAGVRSLLATGADPNAPVLENGNTPLLMAAGSGRVENALLLLEAGADIDAKNGSGHGVDFFAERGEDAKPEAMRALLERWRSRPKAETQAQPHAACGTCGATREEVAAWGEKLQVCTGCRQEQYCSRKCQKRAWAAHKPACRAAAAEDQQQQQQQQS